MQKHIILIFGVPTQQLELMEKKMAKIGMFTMMKLKKIVSEAGLIGDGLKVVSKNKNNDSWDWYGVEVYYHNGDIKTKIFSGNKDKSSDVTKAEEAYNNIGKMIG